MAIIITIKLNASVAHASLELACEASIISNDLLIAASAITEVVSVFRVEGPLHGGQAGVRLR